MKKIFAMIFIAACLTAAVLAAEKAQVVEKWCELKPSFTQLSPYTLAPSAFQTFEPGELKEDFIRDGVNYLNFCRFLAGLPELVYDPSANADMQRAAVLLCAAGYSDTENVPDKMEDDFYKAALAALERSGTAFGFDTLYGSVGGMINDRGQRMKDVLDRRALLAPGTGTVSMGFYDGYAAVSAAVSGAPLTGGMTSWPCAGAFPTFLLKAELPWSITLDPDKYVIRDPDEVFVRISGKTAKNVRKAADITAESAENPIASALTYFSVSGDTVIVRPDGDFIDSITSADDSTVTVTLFGICTPYGEDASVQYTVKFFDMEAAILERYSDRSAILDVQKPAVAELTAAGVLNGYEDGTFLSDANVTRAEFTAMLMRYLDIEQAPADAGAFTDVDKDHWAAGYINKAFEIGAVNGTDPGVFSPEQTVTCDQALKIITETMGFAEGMELEKSGGYPFAYYNLGCELGINDNVVNGDIDMPLTRGDAAAMIYNAYQITDFWLDYSSGSTFIWHRTRDGRGIGCYSYVSFKLPDPV